MNEILDDQTLLKNYKKKIAELQKELEVTRQEKGIADLQQNNEFMVAKLQVSVPLHYSTHININLLWFAAVT